MGDVTKELPSELTKRKEPFRLNINSGKPSGTINKLPPSSLILVICHIYLTYGLSLSVGEMFSYTNKAQARFD